MNFFESNGSSAYLFISRINHSCCPNCFAFTNEGKLNIRTIRNVNEGEEITISYIYLYNPWNERNKILKEYNFICTCERCFLKNDKNLRVIRCEQCKIGKMYENEKDSFKC